MITSVQPFDDLLAGLGYDIELPILRYGVRGIAIASSSGGRALVTVVGPGVAPGALEAVPDWDVPLLETRPIETDGGPRTLVVEGLPVGVPSTTLPPSAAALPPFAAELARHVAETHDAGRKLGSLHPDLVMVHPRTRRLAGVAQRPIRADAAAEPIDGARRFFGEAFLTPSELQGRAPDAADDAFRLAAFVWRWRHGADPFAGSIPYRLARSLAGMPEGGSDDDLDAFLRRCFDPVPLARPSARSIAEFLASG